MLCIRIDRVVALALASAVTAVSCILGIYEHALTSSRSTSTSAISSAGNAL